LADRLAAQSRFSARNRAIMSMVCGLKCELKGADQLPKPPYVILSKHQSTYETLVFACLFPPFVWVLKESLVRVPLLGWALGSFAPIAIDRERPRQALKQVLDEGVARLGAGISVLVFPEGTRFAPGTAGRYHVSGAVLAQRAGVVIVPVALDTGNYWGAYSFSIRPGTIVIRIGAPIRPEEVQGQNAAAIMDVARERMETMMIEARKPVNNFLGIGGNGKE
jgi:1-acyl-sn-glycerol-3-phosphate acyltransferase